MIWFALLVAALAVGLRFLRRFVEAELRTIVTFASFGAAIVAVLATLFSFVAIVPAGHEGIAVVFGRVQDRQLNEGLNFVNPFATVVSMTVRTETYTMSSVRDEGAVKGDDSITALSADGLMMPLDVTLAYRLVQADAPWLFRSIGPDYVDKVIRPASRTAVREAIAGFTAQEAYSTRRQELAANIDQLLTMRLRELLTQHEDFQNRRGFIIEQVMIRNVQLPARVKNAIEEKLEAEQQALRMRFILEKERQEAERKAIEAQGISNFQSIVSKGISEQLLAWKGIEATEQLARSTNSKIVIIGNPKNGMPLIIPTSEQK
jgi:regulator of protease activity HflC (stomatin/prohibitin superfamily)